MTRVDQLKLKKRISENIKEFKKLKPVPQKQKAAKKAILIEINDLINKCSLGIVLGLLNELEGYVMSLNFDGYLYRVTFSKALSDKNPKKCIQKLIDLKIKELK